MLVQICVYIDTDIGIIKKMLRYHWNGVYSNGVSHMHKVQVTVFFALLKISYLLFKFEFFK